MSAPARGEEIAAYFRENQDSLLADSWKQNGWNGGEVRGTASTIQGVICTVDRDNTVSWLLMILDATVRPHPKPRTVSYLALTYGSWAWAWIKADDHLAAASMFIDWLRLNDEYAALVEGRET